jgi:hypothetical protein
VLYDNKYYIAIGTPAKGTVPSSLIISDPD